MKKIIEKSFKISNDKILSDLLKKSFGDAWSDEFLTYYAYLIYLDTKPKQVIYSIVSSSEFTKVIQPSFVEELEMLNHSDFYQLLLLVSTYPHFHDISKVASNSLKNENLHLDKLFKETNGWMVYNYQLEKLFMMVIQNNEEKAKEFRRNINKKDNSKTSELCKTKILGTTLKEVISMRMKLGIVYTPNYDGAYKLYQYLNE